MFPSSRLCFNCSDAAMNMIIDGRRGTVSAAGPQVIWEELDLVWWRKCFLVCLPDRELGGQLQYGGQDHLNWDQDQVKTNTRQRRDENFEGLRPSKDEERYKLQEIFQLIWNIHLPRENTCRRQIKQHTFSLFQLPTHNFPLWGRDKTDQDRVKMQSSPRRRRRRRRSAGYYDQSINICDKFLPRCLFVGNNYSRVSCKNTLLFNWMFTYNSENTHC